MAFNDTAGPRMVLGGRGQSAKQMIFFSTVLA
jgi:hypothetical protein